jgi:fucose permease
VQPAALIETSASRTALAGFFLSGLLFGFPGAILPAWGYHVRPHYVTIGNYFLAINIGLLGSAVLSRILPRAQRLSLALAVACAIAFASLTWLSFTAPPVAESWRLGGFFGLGLGAGALNTGILHAISSAYRLQPAATINLAGAFFGLGSALVALLVAGVFAVYTVSSILFLVAIAPALFAIAFAKAKYPSEVVAEVVTRRRALEDVAREFTIPSAVLFSLLLFFQFGNEWAIAGWLALFLILRLGINPSTALLLLAAYWISLMLGRMVAQSILPRVHHGKLLVGAGFASMFGCIMLTFTDNLFGAVFGTLLVGFGFAPIYPLVVENIGARFPHYHPGFFNGIFSLALTGGMLAPATLGYAAEVWGIGIVMMLPMIGSMIVCVLVVVIWLESKLLSPKL